MDIKTVPIDSIFLDPNNTRDHAAKNINAIKGSLAKFQQVEPLVVQKSKKIIIGGNGRYRAMQEMGYKEVQIVEVDVDDLQAAALSITLNRTAELATWNDDLSAVLKSLQEANFDVGEIGFDAKDLENFCPTPIAPGLTDDDAVPENVETRCKPGDLWILGNHRLLCGDSTNVQHVDRLMNGEKADMVFTDPPYGVSFVGLKGSMYSAGFKKGEDSAAMIKNDDLSGVDLTALFKDALSLATLHVEKNSCMYIFFAINKSLEVIKAINDCDLTIRNWLIWDKGNVGFHAMGAQYKPNYESFLYCHLKDQSPTWVGTPQQQTIWRHTSERLGLHPTMKPVSLIEQAIGNHPSKIVLDLFLGSGSTLIACEKTGRKC